MNLWAVFLIAVSLSMDAFSLAISIGTLSMSTKSKILLSSIVGCFHFIMPLIGSFCGFIILKNTHLSLNLLSGIIFLYIGIQMLKDFKEKGEIEFNKNVVGFLFFAIGVSLDSFGAGMTFNLNFNIVFSLIMFSICSFTFTFFGLFLGGITNKLLGKPAIIIGAVIMFILAVVNFVNFCCY